MIDTFFFFNQHTTATIPQLTRHLNDFVSVQQSPPTSCVGLWAADWILAHHLQSACVCVCVCEPSIVNQLHVVYSAVLHKPDVLK